MKKYFYFLLFSFCFLLIITCTTQPQSGNLTGTVQLAGEADHSGIIIGIYELTTLDPDIDEANTKWPHIGVIINQHTEFDHRFGTLVKTGETDASGYFEINDIPTGNYNVVAIKDGFGFKYIYEISISDGDNSLSNLMKRSPLNDCFEETDRNSEMNSEECKLKNESLSSPHYSLSIIHSTLDSKDQTAKIDLTLYPETVINADITTATTFESHHHYIIGQDIIIDDELTIQPGAVIRLNEGVKLTISGDLTAVGNEYDFIWFTANDSLSFLPFTFNLLSSPLKEDIALYNRVELTGSLNKQVSFCKFDHAGTGLLNHVNGFEISDCIFKDSQCGFKAEDVDSAFCSNLLCEKIYNESEGGIYFSHVTEGCIEKNVINDYGNGIKIYNHSNPELKNNYVSNCNNGVDISYGSSPDVHNNEIYECDKGVYTHAGSYPEIYRNEIQGDYGFVAYQCNAPNTIRVTYNNLSCNKYAIQLIKYGYNTTNDINGENNYFYTINEDEIQELIYDKNDVEPSQQQYYGIVDYFPFLTDEYPYAGIQGE